jgi:hypothetical protein
MIVGFHSPCIKLVCSLFLTLSEQIKRSRKTLQFLLSDCDHPPGGSARLVDTCCANMQDRATSSVVRSRVLLTKEPCET